MTEFTSPAVQAMNLIRYIGDQVSESGEPLDQLSGISESIGAPSEELANELVEELYERGLEWEGLHDPLTERHLYMSTLLSKDGPPFRKACNGT